MAICMTIDGASIGAMPIRLPISLPIGLPISLPIGLPIGRPTAKLTGSIGLVGNVDAGVPSEEAYRLEGEAS